MWSAVERVVLIVNVSGLSLIVNVNGLSVVSGCYGGERTLS